MKKLITLLNDYVRYREIASSAETNKTKTRDAILALLPRRKAAEWDVKGWGTVTYKAPKDTLKVNLELLKANYPEAYAECVDEVPSTPRFLVHPQLQLAAATLRKESHARIQTA